MARISKSHSGEKKQARRARACEVEESAAGAAVRCRVIYVGARATKCRNQIGACSEMNSGICGLLTDSSCLPSTMF